MPLTLVIPELLWPEPEDRETQEALACPALEALIGRATQRLRPAVSYEAALCDAAGLPENSALAALRRLGEAGVTRHIDAGQPWIAADPVHLRFLQERLILADPSQLALTAGEAEALVAAFNLELAEFGRFHLGSAGRWYLEPATPELATEHHAPPLSAVAGRSVERLLPSVSEARAQRRLQHAAQMLLHSHPVNLARDAAGQMTVNALWLWGGGALPSTRENTLQLEQPFSSVWSIDPLARGLAHAAGLPVQPPPAEATTLLPHISADAHVLVTLGDLATAVQYESRETYRETLAGLDTKWFAPLLSALRRGTLRGPLTLLAPTVYGLIEWQLTRPASWAFWRPATPLSTRVKTLAAATATGS